MSWSPCIQNILSKDVVENLNLLSLFESLKMIRNPNIRNIYEEFLRLNMAVRSQTTRLA